ncbi:helix-turn-helix domain-containing protein [Ferrimonas lipolytica]|nr:helix-turn-helix domain-containing protein [Ferrimonas lipolytica]QIZ75787.1 winged helix-turn-helix domain-containing protein [Ferrimonas lipolytica]
MIYKETAKYEGLMRYVMQRSSEYLYASRDMALMRSLLKKRENIALRLMVLCVSMEGYCFNLTMDEISLISGVSPKYCADYIKDLEQRGILKKGYRTICIRDLERLMAEINPQVLAFFGNYLKLNKNK